jgi:hypothetical protein
MCLFLVALVSLPQSPFVNSLCDLVLLVPHTVPGTEQYQVEGSLMAAWCAQHPALLPHPCPQSALAPTVTFHSLQGYPRAEVGDQLWSRPRMVLNI